MKAIVLRRFRDKKTGEFYGIDAVYEGSAERVKEIQRKGFLGEVIEGEQEQETSVLDGSVEEVKNAVDGFDQEALNKILAEEKEGKNRKGVVEYIESLLTEPDGDGSDDQQDNDGQQEDGGE